jgi:CRISP-associated protein Cas1
MTVLYLVEPHGFVVKRGETLVVRVDGQPPRTLPLARVSQVVCCGDVSWSGAALRELLAESIAVAYIGPRGEWVGRWEPEEGKAVPLRRTQFRAADDPERSRAIAVGIVEGKLRNQRALLQRALREGMIVEAPEMDAIAALIRRVPVARDVDEIRGLEGAGASSYFPAYGRLVSRHGFTFLVRRHRPPPDPVNALLSFGYALLRATTAAAVRTVGFDAHVGFLHTERYGRESLALDLMEEFRVPVVDALAAALINKRVLCPADFDLDATACTMRPDARKTFIRQYESKLESQLSHPVLGTRISYRRAIEIQARILAKFLTGELPGYVAFTRR